MQQAFRSVFGAREVGVDLPEWMMGAIQDHRHHRGPDQWPVRDGADTADHRSGRAAVAPLAMGPQVRAVVQNRVMAGAVGIDTQKVDRLTFALGCGIAGVAGSAFTMVGSTGPTAGQLYIVDTFLVVVFGGAQSSDRHDRLRLRDLAIAVDARILPVRLHGARSRRSSAWSSFDAAPAGALCDKGAADDCSEDNPLFSRYRTSSASSCFAAC